MDRAGGRAAGPALGALPSPVVAAALLAASVSLLPAAPAAARAQETTEVRTARRDLGRVERLEVDLEHTVGRLTVRRAEPGVLYRRHLQYDADRIEPASDWSRDGSVGRLRLGLQARGDGGRWFRWDGLDIDLNLGALRNLEAGAGRADLHLSRSVPTSLSLSVGAAEADLRLGGLPLTSLTVETGASQTEVSFGRPNPVPMDRMRIRAGAASFRGSRLGNARFDELDIEGGVGDVRLDFRGEWDRDATASVDLGLGSLRLVFPEELGVRIRRESFLSSFDVPPGFRRTDSGYESENWSSAEHRLRLDVSAALGSVSVRVGG